ncbi:hypothetical protein RB195_003273 [Necator americanus]|uniref:VWFA domain-containing protein n=1 Tax=Necator americanus TaxID=51031 RepID=A0ABR1DMW1_NECAM
MFLLFRNALSKHLLHYYITCITCAPVVHRFAQYFHLSRLGRRSSCGAFDVVWHPVAHSSGPTIVVETHHVSGPPNFAFLSICGSVSDLRLQERAKHKTIILFSDGDNDNIPEYYEFKQRDEASKCRDVGIRILYIMVGDDIDEPVCVGVAGGYENTISVGGFQASLHFLILLIILNTKILRWLVFTRRAGTSISSTNFVPLPLSSKMFSTFVSDLDEVLEPYPAELSAGPSV